MQKHLACYVDCLEACHTFCYEDEKCGAVITKLLFNMNTIKSGENTVCTKMYCLWCKLDECIQPRTGGQYHHLLPDGVEGDISNSLQLIALHMGPPVLPAWYNSLEKRSANRTIWKTTGWQ